MRQCPTMQLRPPVRQCPTTRPLSRITSLLTFLTKEKLTSLSPPNDFVRIGGEGAYDDSTSPIEVEMTSVILSVPGTKHALPTNVLDHVVTALLDDWLV
jgi:hypothetical protein